MADVTINYKGSAIAAMSASGTKTLETEGKYCEDDIEVVYVSPGGGGSTLGTKAISSNGTYEAEDDGYDGYSEVTVSVPTGPARSSSDLTASGLTVTAPAGLYAAAASKTLTDANLVAGNIKKDVTIFGTTGTYEGGGSSVINGSITFASQTAAKGYTINVGSSFTHFVMYPVSSPYGIAGTRTWAGCVYDDNGDTGGTSNTVFWMSSNTGGTASAGAVWSTNTNSIARKSGNSIILGGTNTTMTDVFPAGMTYVWFAW